MQFLQFCSESRQHQNRIQYLWHRSIIYFFLISMLAINRVQPFIVTKPLPQLYYDNELLEMGSQKFDQTMNTVPSPNYLATATITFKKMNKNLPNAYEAFVSWRGANIYFHQQSLGLVKYALWIASKNQTDMKIAFGTDFSSGFLQLTGNYLLIHQSLVTNKLMYGMQFSTTVQCVGAAPTPTVCIYPETFKIPATGFTSLVFIQYLRFYRDEAFTTNNLDIEFIVEIIDQSNINIKLLFGQLGLIDAITGYVIAYNNTLADFTTKKILMIAPIQTPIPLSTLNSTLYTIPLSPLKVYNNSFFVGLSRIISKQMQFSYQLFADTTTFTLKGSINFTNADAFYKGFALYGYKCSGPFYFSNQTQQCELCPILNCQTCIADILGVVTCTQCADNYFISADKLSCDCNMDVIASVCDTLTFPDQVDCVNAKRTIGNAVQCLFCSPNQFKYLQNNNCYCINGYNDDDKNGICQETCGDGLVFNAQCDDGNLNSNDGCSPNCNIETGFKCENSQPSYCQSLSMLRYIFGSVKKIEGLNQGEITLFVKNLKVNLPFLVLAEQFLPQLTHIKLYLISNQSLNQQVEITNLKLKQIDQNYTMRFIFDYGFIVESFKGRIVLNYSNTRYFEDSQEIRFGLEGIDLPLIYSSNLKLFKIIAIAFAMITVLNLIMLIISLSTPKFIGLESIITLQLIFYSQMLIDNPSNWPIGFVCFKYLKFASGFNSIINLTNYETLSVSTKKYFHIEMDKSLIQNFNTNFLILMISFMVFIIIFCIKSKYQSLFQKQEFNRKYLKKGEYQLINVDKLIDQIRSWRKICDQVFWVANHLAYWLILPLIASFSTQLFIQNTLVTVNSSNFMAQLLLSLRSIIGSISFPVIFLICLNHFRNLWLSRQCMKKLSLKPEEIIYKRAFFIYLLTIGVGVLFFNQTQLSGIPFSVIILLIQLAYTVLLLVINPYRQSLRIHSVVLFINQGIYILFLILMIVVNLFKNFTEIFMLIFVFSMIAFCLISAILTGIRLFYQLKYGQQLEKEIQREREKQIQAQKLKDKQLYVKKMKQLKYIALNQQTDLQKLRAKNRFLFENQLNEDKSKYIMQWLEQTKWQPEDKEKYFIEKSTFHPLEWLRNHDKAEFEKQMIERQEYNQQIRQKQAKKMINQDYRVVAERLKKEADRNIYSWNRKLQNHEKRIQKDLNYAMNVKKDGTDRYMRLEYELKR